MSEDAIDITVQVTGGDDRLVRVTVLPSVLDDVELGRLVRAQIRRLLTARRLHEESLLDV